MINLHNKVISLESFELSSMSISTKNDVLLSIAKADPNDGILEKTCLLVSQLLTLSKSQEIEYIVIKDMIPWLQKVLLLKRSLIKTVMNAVKILIKYQFTADILAHLFYPIKSLLQLSVDHLLIEITPDNKECIMSVIDILNLLVNDGLLNSSSDSNCNKVTILETVTDIIFQINFSENMQFQIANYLFIPIYTLPILSKISEECSEYFEFHSGDLFGLIIAYMHFDLRGHIKHPKKILISHQSIYNSLEDMHDVKCQQSPGGKVSRTPKPRFHIKGSQSVQITDNFQQKLSFPTTDRQKLYFIDDLVSQDDYKSEDNLINQCSEIRLAALTLFNLLTKSFKSYIFYGYWHAFFPYDASCKEGILYVVISDANVRCRTVALEIATHIIFGAKAFLEQAEVPKKSPTSYMPLCFSLGQMLQAMYNVLNHVLATESSLSVLINVLKCLSALVQATPFHRMHCDLVGGFLPHIRKLLDHEDESIQFSALMVLEMLISTPKITKEISDILEMPFELDNLHENTIHLSGSFALDSIQVECSEQFINNCDEKQSSVITKHIPGCDSWLLKVVLKKLQQMNHELPALTRKKSLQVLSSMSIHFSMLINSLEEIAMSLNISILDISTDVNLCATRCLDNIAYNMSKYLLYNESDDQSCQNFWINMIPLATKKIAEKHQSTAVKISLIDFLSNIGVIVFNRLPNLAQINLQSFLYGISSDTEEDTAVRAASIRALAVYVLFPSLKQDLVFVENTAELAILLVSDRSLNVRIKSLWSIGNISDALASNCELVRDERISKKLLTRLIKVSLNACNDNDKVRCNSVRALGNFMRLISTEMLDDLYCRRLFQDVTQKLVYCVKASGSAKVKWNSCYAIGCILQNNALFLSNHEDLTWIEAIFTTLCKVIVQHSNYKVRINATNAITHISERSFYAQYFKLCWCSLMNALEDSYDFKNFLEYNHRDYLQERLCIALCHIIRLASNADLHEIGKEIEKRVEIIKEIWFRVLNRMSPENAAPLLTCPVLLKERLKQQSSLTDEQTNSICLLTYSFCS